MAPPKGSRRGQSALSQVSTVSPNATPARSTTKSNKNTKIVILKLLPDVLSQFPHDAPTLVEPLAKAVTTTSDSVSSSSSAVSAKKKAGKEFTPLAKPGDSDEAQSPDKSMAQAEEEKLVKAGTKREAEQPLSEDGKPKPKAPLRKRPKVYVVPLSPIKLSFPLTKSFGQRRKWTTRWSNVRGQSCRIRRWRPQAGAKG